jgi:hypothetical protein
MEFKEAVLSAIKDYEGESEGVRYEVIGVEMYEDLPKGMDAVDYDGEVGWDENDVEYEVFACVINTAMAGEREWSQATLLRSVGRERKDGKAYGGLDVWFPKNAFVGTIWSKEEQVELLQKRFAYINDANLFFYHVRVIEE